MSLPKVKTIDQTRIKLLSPNAAAHQLSNTKNTKSTSVVYWMTRDQRVQDNWSLLFALELAEAQNSSLIVTFNVIEKFSSATQRHYDFMLEGLQQVEKALNKLNVPLIVSLGNPEQNIAETCSIQDCVALVSDFSPLKAAQDLQKKLSSQLPIPFYIVDTHNIVPCWVASGKQEYSARSFRPKITALLPRYLKKIPQVKTLTQNNPSLFHRNDWQKIRAFPKVERGEKHEIEWIKSGETNAQKMLDVFTKTKLKDYEKFRNFPELDFQSNLSPYIHFGQISTQRIALETQSNRSFLEELVVRRELSENFCFYNRNYDSIEGFPTWAQKTLTEHLKDQREFLYSLEQLETAKTHDIYWNTAQKQMTKTGKMHGYMRMYWAKKILEWTRTPEEALKHAIYLNDKYELDGRDPNGYTGIAWSIGGVHDRPWFERPVFGKIRFMSANGLKSKFDIQRYVEKYGEQNEYD